MPARPRAAASLSRGTSSVVAISSATRSDIVSKPSPASPPSAALAVLCVRGSSEVGGRAKWARRLEVHESPPGARVNRIFRAAAAPTMAPIPSIRDTSRGLRRLQTGPRPRRAQGTGRAGSPSCAPSSRGATNRTSDGTSAARNPIIRASATPRPSMAPSSNASLTSPIPRPFGYASAAASRKADAPSGSEQPLDARVDHGVGDEDDDCSWDHDPVRHEPVAEIGGGERDEDDHEERRQRRVRRCAEDEHAGDDERGGDCLDGRVERRDAGVAASAAAPQEQIGDDRDVVPGLDLRSALRATRARLRHREPQGERVPPRR